MKLNLKKIKRLIRDFIIDSKLYFILRFIHRKKAIIIMYHSFFDDTNSIYNNVNFDIKLFEQQLKYLKKHYNVISFDRLIQILQSKKNIPKYSVILTFDDGYKSNYTLAYPLLKKYDLHATIFLTYDYIGTDKWFWVNELQYILHNTKTNALDIQIGDEHLSFTFFESKERETVYLELKEKLKKIPLDQLLKTINYISKQLKVDIKGVTIENYSMLSWSDILNMNEKFVDFGCHTASHILLSMIEDKDNLRNEIIVAKKQIEKKLNRVVQSFCYPNGDYNKESLALVKESYSAAITVKPGYVSDKNNIFELPRISGATKNFKDFIWFLVSYK